MMVKWKGGSQLRGHGREERVCHKTAHKLMLREPAGGCGASNPGSSQQAQTFSKEGSQESKTRNRSQPVWTVMLRDYCSGEKSDIN